MHRKNISKAEIESWLNHEIRKHEDCEDVSVSIQELREPDDDGLYWAVSDYVHATGISRQTLMNALERVLAEARSQFDLIRTD